MTFEIRPFLPQTDLLTWEELVRREPGLLDLLREAKSVRDDKRQPSFCATALWYGRFAPRLERLVGRFAQTKDGIIETDPAYSLAVNVIRGVLPRCRNCHCR